jgi:ABC-2 type transport system permease protein
MTKAKAEATSARPARVAAAQKEGTILDRGYQPYRGRHTTQASRWQVIAGRTLKLAARQWWAILLLVATVVPLLVSAVQMWIWSKLATVAPEGTPLTSPDHYIMLPWGTMTLAFLLALFAGAGQVADDARAGAFQFYFARPVTREQYLVGKLVPVLTLTLFIALGPMLLLSLLRLALLSSTAEVWRKLPLVGAAIVVGCIEALALAAPAVAFSSLSKRRAYVQGGFAIAYLMPWVMGAIFVNVMRSPWPAILSVPAHIENLAEFIFRMPPPEDARRMPVWVSALFLSILVAGSIALLRKRLSAVEVIAS